MVWGIMKAAANLDPLGMVEETVKTTGQVASAGVNAVVDPLGAIDDARKLAIKTAGDTVDFAASYVPGAHISVAGIDLEIDTPSAAAFLYDALVPKTAQAVLGGRLPSEKDFTDDAFRWVGGPIEGIYVGATSESAQLIQSGQTPSAEQIQRDMFDALTPVAMAQLGL